ncbi:MAG: flagellar biosynthesis protein FlgM [Caulobacteraceae bacterium]|nr:MAG: flagellar biosynthesis protein FlgM [Caulobacteraceae bacterium]
MEWRGGRRGGNIEDRRGMGPGAAVGGVGVVGLVAAAIGYFVFGISPEQTLSAIEQGGPVSQQEGQRGTPQDEAGQFVDVIETSTTEVWTAIYAASGKRYQPPASAVLYEQATGTGCGTGQSAMGPFYCPADQKVYLDLSFWNELETKFGASGEFARAYVIAHEVGHHVQNLEGAMQQAQRQGMRGEDSGAVRLELQADCYAGVWAARAGTQAGGGLRFNAQDITDGLGAASAVGDDTIQQKTQGRVVPDAFTHGTAAQRMRWFRAGYEAGDPAACNTFSARSL